MAPALPPLPVKYFTAVLYRDTRALDLAQAALTAAWGALDIQGPDRLFNVTDYYEPEMGTALVRRLMSFKVLMPPEHMADVKLRCNDIEDELAATGKRIVNLDAGYLDHNKVLLASAKEAGQKIYLDKGIYADLAGRWREGRYQPFEWSFPDFRDGRYDPELGMMRREYLNEIKKWKSEKKKQCPFSG